MNAARFARFGLSLAGLVALGWVLAGQAAPPLGHGVPLVQDWSHRHLIFSRPQTPELLQRAQQDPRYWQQLQRDVAPRMTSGSRFDAGVASSFAPGSEQLATMVGSRKLHRDWSESLGSGAATGAGVFPAKFALGGGTANCSTDFVVFGTGLPGSAGQASVVAYSNLYSGCGGTVPLTYWAFNTGGQVMTSPVFSRDGSQVAFAQTSGGVGSMVLLKWASGNGSVGTPSTPTTVAPGAYRACGAPCMTTFALAADDTTSSVFVDYSGDIAWVGDSSGSLHKFTGVFLGTPAEATAPWPVQVNGGAAPVSSPVFDQASRNVFVGDVGGSGGFLYRVDASTGAVITSAQLDFGAGIVEGPIVDSARSLVYVFISNDGTTNCNAAVDPCSAVYQLPAGFAVGDSGPEVTIGDSSATPNPIYIGAFDHAYYISGNATGSLYVCGTAAATLNPTLYQIPILAGVLGNPLPGIALSPSANTPACSPVTDVYNPNVAGGPTEWVFASVQNHGVAAPCSGGGCVFNLVDTAWKASTVYAVGQEILSPRLHIEVVTTGGTSGAVQPGWTSSAGFSVTDNGVHWLDQGLLAAGTLPGWLPNLVHNRGFRILDPVGNIQVVTAAVGTKKTGTVMPAFSATPGLSVVDNGTLTWTNAGAIATHALASAGGTSGIIIDNYVNSITLVGASQIYFSTLSNQTCVTSSTTGGCAVQASQPGLQ
jgi:hypothetical protein